MKYTEKVISVVDKALNQREKVSAQIEALEKQYKKEEISGVDYRSQMEVLTGLVKSIELDAWQKVSAISADYRARVDQNSVIDATMLHEDAKLLQLDMEMTERQFEALVQKHKDNPLMVQLLWEYSNKHKGLYPGSLPTAEAKIGAFAGFVDAAMNAINEPDSLRAAFFQTGQYTPKICTESE